MAFIYDLADTQELTGYVRNVPITRGENLRTFLPSVAISDLEYRFAKGGLVDPDVAQYRAFDTEAGIAKRPGIARVSGELPPLSRKVRLGEEDRLRLNSLLSGGGNGTADQRIQAIFDDAGNMARSVQARITQAVGQALYDGRVIIAENGLSATVDFGIPAGHRVTAGTVWSNVASDPITDMTSWKQTYIDTNGVEPGVMVTSTTVVNYLLKNTILKGMGGLGNLVGPILRRNTLDVIVQELGLPMIMVDDTTVRVDGVATRVIPANRVVMLPMPEEPLGSTLYGITAEALELTEAGQLQLSQAPGIVAVVDKTFDPVSIWTKAAAIALPVVANAELILTATVA